MVVNNVYVLLDIFCAPLFLLLTFGASLFSFFSSNFCSELVCLPFISCVHSLPILFSSVAYNRVLNSPAFSWHVLLEKCNKCGQHTEHFSTWAGRCCTVQSLTVNWRLLVCGDGLSFSDVGNTHWDFTSDFFFFLQIWQFMYCMCLWDGVGEEPGLLSEGCRFKSWPLAELWCVENPSSSHPNYMGCFRK